MGSEERVVLIDRSAEQRGASAGDREREARQHARVVREQAVVAALDIPERVRKQESVRILQCESRQQSATFTGFIGQAHTLPLWFS